MDSNNNDPMENMLRYYVLEYLTRTGRHHAAYVFMNEGNVPEFDPIGREFMGSMLDSSDGVLLHEWWSTFYPVFDSRRRRHQESNREPSNKVVQRITNAARNNPSFRIPQIPKNEQGPQQFQPSSSFNNMMPPPAAHLISPRLYINDHLGNVAEQVDPILLALINGNGNANNPNFFLGSSSIHPSQDVGTQVQQQVYKDSGVGMHVGSPMPRNPLDARQKAMLPLDGPHVTNNYEAPNFVPMNGWPLNMPTSILQIPNYGQQQPEVLNTQNQDAILTQALTSTPNSQTFTAPQNFTSCNNQYPEIPKTESNNNYRELVDQTVGAGEPQCKQDQQMQMQSQNLYIMDQTVRAGEPQHKQDQQMQMQSQNLDKSRKRKIIPPVVPGECVPMMDQTVRAGEPQFKQDQPLQTQSQNLDKVIIVLMFCKICAPILNQKSRKRNMTAPVASRECVPDCVDPADGKPADENVDSYLSIENADADLRTLPFSNLKRNSGTKSRNQNKGFSLKEVGCLHSSKSKVLASHFSSNGNFLASVGHDKKVFIWDVGTFQSYATEETHSLLITDVRFRPQSTIFATSSFDRSIRLWDTTKPTKSLFKLSGHSEQVMSLDFHPEKVDILCSCDNNDIIRLWNVNKRSCLRVTKGGSKQVRFQPLGMLLATATGNNLKIIDVETDKLVYNLKGHDKDVLSICWDRTGKYIASVSEDCARVWSNGECIGELHSNGNKFQSCIFHPGYCNLLVIGGYQSLEFWCPTDESSRTVSVSAHKGLIAGLADSPEAELIASASHDCFVKLWK
uniref:Lissencephaly type-1-like homology motif; WD40-like n=1 Tax=Medicago truncatula TaxID=3880 RepID=Q2HTS2_MEDTR|nr:Lissencephaly type-1-like homology motif; WD40-like [Medicago truncatula]